MPWYRTRLIRGRGVKAASFSTSAIRPWIRRAADSSEGGRLVGERVDVASVIDIEPAAEEEAPDAAIDDRQQPRHVLVTRCLRGMELQRTVGALAEHPVQEQRMEVDVELKSAPEALDHRHGVAPPIARASAARLLPIETEDGTHRDAENRAAELVIPGKEVAQSARQAEDPLAHRHRRKDVVDQVCGVRRHAAAAAARTEAPQEKGTSRSNAQSSHRTRAKPRVSAPQVRNSRNSRSMNRGRPSPSP